MKDIKYNEFIADLCGLMLNFCNDFELAMKVGNGDPITNSWFSDRRMEYKDRLAGLLSDPKYVDYMGDSFSGDLVILGDTFYGQKSKYFRKIVDQQRGTYYERKNDKIAREGGLHDAINSVEKGFRKLFLNFKEGYVIDEKANSKGENIVDEVDFYRYALMKVSSASLKQLMSASFYLVDEKVILATKYLEEFKNALNKESRYLVRNSEGDIVCSRKTVNGSIDYYSCFSVATMEEKNAYAEEKYARSGEFGICLIVNKKITVEDDYIEEQLKNREVVEKKNEGKSESFFPKLFTIFKKKK